MRTTSSSARAPAALAGVLGAVGIGLGALATPASFAATPSTPSPRSGTTAAGVPFVLRGRSVRITVPASTREGRRITVRCGRQTTADLLASGIGFRSTVQARGSRVFRERRRLTIALARDVSAIAEWCEFKTSRNGASGAAVLKPRIGTPPPPLVSGPTVREGAANGGAARFLVDGSTVTLRADRPLRGDIVLLLACYVPGTDGSLRITGARTLAIGTGRRVVTADLGVDVESAGSCLAEDATAGGRDLFYSEFGAVSTA